MSDFTKSDYDDVVEFHEALTIDAANTFIKEMHDKGWRYDGRSRRQNTVGQEGPVWEFVRHSGAARVTLGPVTSQVPSTATKSSAKPGSIEEVLVKLPWITTPAGVGILPPEAVPRDVAEFLKHFSPKDGYPLDGFVYKLDKETKVATRARGVA